MYIPIDSNSISSSVPTSVGVDETNVGNEVLNFSDAWSAMWGKVESWLDGFVTMLPNIVLALVVLAGVVFFSRFVRAGITRIMQRISNNKAVNRLAASLASFVVVLLGIILTLGILDLDRALSSMLAGAGIAGLVIGLAFQDSMANLLAGVLMSVRKQYNIGDHVATNDIEGKIEQISLRTIHIRTFQGQRVLIPNRMIIENPLKNYTITGERRIDIDCGVSYGDDLEKAKQTALQAVRATSSCNKDRDVSLYYHGFGSSSIDFTVRFWLGKDCYEPSDFLQARDEAIIAIHKAFNKAGITIPFPIRTLDFDAKGGEKLNVPLQDIFPLHS